MAKKKTKEGASSGGRADAVRTAVDQAFQTGAAQGAAAAGQGRERAQDIVEQFAQAAGRVREVLDELRPPTGDELRSLRQQVASLEKRVAELEKAAAKPAAKPAAKRRSTPAKRTSRSTGGRSGGSSKST